MLIDCGDASPQLLYRVLLSCVSPRPIAWISSVGADNVLNLAPFSFYNAFSANPPILGIGIGSRRRPASEGNTQLVPKDTYNNIVAGREFVVNVVSLPIIEQMNQTSGEYAPEVDEFERAGLTAVPSHMVKPPRVKESLVSMECTLYQTVPLGQSNLVLGQIVCIHCSDDVWQDNGIDLDRLQPVGRLSGNSYCRTDGRFDLNRPTI